MTFKNKVIYLYKNIIGNVMYRDKYGVVMIRRNWFSRSMPFLDGLRHEDGTSLTDRERLEINSFLMEAFGVNSIVGE